MNASEKILFHQSSPIMRAIGYLLLCYPVGIFSIFYLSSLRSNSSFLQGLLFLWQESPGFYVYIGGFLGLSLLMLGTKLKITSQAIYYTLAGFRISLCLKRHSVHYSFLNPRYDSLKAHLKRWLSRTPAHLISQRDGTLDFRLCQPGLINQICLGFFRIQLSMFSRQQAQQIMQAIQTAWNFRA
ncbi:MULTISPECIES: hypothetical protein [Acinetobacter]|uniref:hypothetical protein n=1 Tax=Acinetobacter TaxID=469 RepID=UPI0015D1B4B8|nr:MULTISPECIES: hypothetical protein [Acinetobacter]MDM1341665.1 hypothetical protein [Acinetobacter pseudolwoffii]HJE55013.1 hypothetical protein [Acinetobacter pseudolwoffii]